MHVKQLVIIKYANVSHMQLVKLSLLHGHGTKLCNVLSSNLLRGVRRQLIGSIFGPSFTGRAFSCPAFCQRLSFIFRSDILSASVRVFVMWSCPAVDLKHIIVYDVGKPA